MATFKVLGGQFSEAVNLADAKVRSKLDEGATVDGIDCTFGQYLFKITTKWGSPMFTDTDPSFLKNVDEIMEITEENAVNVSGAAGWAIVGGVLTGGVGALAGALLGGRGKSVTFAIKFKDGSQFLCSGKVKNYTKLLAASGKF